MPPATVVNRDAGGIRRGEDGETRLRQLEPHGPGLRTAEHGMRVSSVSEHATKRTFPVKANLATRFYPLMSLHELL